MPISNYPDGFTGGLTVRGLPIQAVHPGQVHFVNGSSVLMAGQKSGGADTGKGTLQAPFATIDYAIGRCTASRGDVIMVAPGHTETVTTDGGIACDVAGVAIIGLGAGSLRPKIILDSAAAAAVTVSAANVSLKNLVFEASFADVTNAIDVTAANLTIEDCEFQEEGANLNFVDIVAATGADNTADGLTITGCKSTAIDDAINSLVNITGDLDGLTVNDNLVIHDNANALAMILCATGKDLTNCEVARNKYLTLKASGDLLIDNDTTANSGMVYENLVSHADTAGEVICDADGVGLFDNKGSGVITASGYLLPVADS